MPQDLRSLTAIASNTERTPTDPKARTHTACLQLAQSLWAREASFRSRSRTNLATIRDDYCPSFKSLGATGDNSVSNLASPEVAVATALKDGLVRIGSSAADRLDSGLQSPASAAMISKARVRIAEACAKGFSTHPDLNSGEAVWTIQRIALAAFDKRLNELSAERSLSTKAA
jgi:hypothetical protein